MRAAAPPFHAASWFVPTFRANPNLAINRPSRGSAKISAVFAIKTMILKRWISRVVARRLQSRGLVAIPITQLKLHERRATNFDNLCAAYETTLNLEESVQGVPPSKNRSNLLARQFGTPPSEAYVVLAALHRSLEAEGEVCEFGVAQGEFSALLADEIRNSGKSLHLFDSFEGLPAPGPEDQLKDDVLGLGTMAAYTGQMSNPESLVRSRLKEISLPEERFIIHKGFFKDLLEEKLNFPGKVCFAYVDFDLYEPIKQVLSYLDSVSSGGAIFVVDDYDFFSTGAKTAVDEFVAEMNSAGPRYHFDVPPKQLGHCAILTRL